MSAPTNPDVPRWLAKSTEGDRAAAAELFEAVYVELRRLAGRYLRNERPGHTLQPTALVHEAYLRLVGGDPIDWQNRAQFFSIAAQVMRHILVDHARRHAADKRGANFVRVPIDDLVDRAVERHIDLVALDGALRKLAAIDPALSQVVELRYFVGLTIAEVATLLGVADVTINRRWKAAKLWLHDALRDVASPR